MLESTFLIPEAMGHSGPVRRGKKETVLEGGLRKNGVETLA